MFDDTIRFTKPSIPDKKVEPKGPVKGAAVEADALTAFAQGFFRSGARVPAPAQKKEGIELMDGERELTTGLLSKGANFRLLVSGRVGKKELERLIQKLELDKEILADDETTEIEEVVATAKQGTIFE